MDTTTKTEKQPRTSLVIWGAIISLVGLFLPLFTFASLNLAFTKSAWDLFLLYDKPYIPLILAPPAMFIGVLAVRSKASWGKTLLGAAHLSQAFGLLWTIYHNIQSGAYAQAVAAAYQKSTGIEDFFPEARMEYGFYVLLIGLALAFLGTTLFAEEV